MSTINIDKMKLQDKNIVFRDTLPDVIVREYVKDGEHHIIIGDNDGSSLPADHAKVVGRHSMIKPCAWMFEVNLEKGTKTPLHAHNTDSLLYIISGRVRVTVDGQVAEVKAGDSVFHPKGVIHNNEALEDSRFIEVKVPPPQDADGA
jgi:quercetin dioxygenase-like cupin family protein